MLNLLKKLNLLRFVAHLLYPYIAEDHERREAHALKEILSQFKSCGRWYHIKSPYTLKGVKYISIGENFRTGAHLRLEAIDSYGDETYSPEIIIGDDVVMQELCHIACVERISIGSGTLLGSKVFISDHMHGDITTKDLDFRPELRKLSHKSVSIGENVWVGDGACILAGVTLDDNVIVGANAVVTHNFPANSVIAGCPAKLIKTLK